jgi:hypothetical protein
MKFFVKLLAVFLSVASVSSWAGDSDGLITILYIQSPGVALVKAGTIVNTPGCNTANQWAVSLSAPDGKSMYALLLQAQSQGLPIGIHGDTGACGDWPDRERPSYMYIVP